MERKESISRRSAIKAFAGISAASVGLVLQDKVSSYVRYLSSRNRESIPLERWGVEQYIQAPEVDTPANVNKTVFAEELRFIAEKENPSKGALWLHSFLREFPLEIQFPQKDAEPVVSKNDIIRQPKAGYIPALFNGPTFIFYPSFVQEYLRAKHEIDVAAQVANDMIVWHEVVHLWQDIKSPIKQIVTTGAAESFEKLSHNGVIKLYNPDADPFEKEAWEKASEIVESRFKGLVKAGDYENWPFGRFFD